MSNLSAALGSSGDSVVVTVNGKEYAVSHITQRIKSAFSRWIYNQHIESLVQARQLYADEEFIVKRDSLVKAWDDGEYEFLSERGQRYLKSNVGALKFSSLLFGVSEDEMFRLIAADPDRVKSTLELVKTESFPRPND